MVRFFALISVAPMYSSNVVPNSIKLSLAFVATAIIFPLVANTRVQAANTFVEYFLTIVNEAMIGILIGFFISILFAGYQVMSDFFQVQIGFSMTETLDPISQTTVPIMAQFQNLISILVFIAIEGHSLVIRTLMYSFKMIPVLSGQAKAMFNSSLPTIYEKVIYYMSSLFSVSLSLALPIMLTLFLVSLSLGLLAKAAPQMNVLMLGFPIQVGVGLITYLLLTPVLIRTFMRVMQITFSDIADIISYLGRSPL